MLSAHAAGTRSGRGLRYARSRGRHTDNRASDRGPGPALAGDPRAPRTSVAAPLAITFPIAAAEARGATLDRRRRQHLRRLRRRRRLPERRPCAPARRPGRAGPARSVLPHRLHGRSVRGLRDAVRALAPARAARRSGEGGVLQRRHRGGRERGQVRPRLHRPAGRDRLRGRLPWPHLPLARAHLEDAAVQGGPRPVRAGGLPRPVQRYARRRPRRAARFRRWSRPRTWQRSCSSRCRAREASSRRRRSSSPASASSATSTGSSWSATRCRPGSRAPGRFFAIEHYGIAPDLITVAKSIAMGIPLSGVLGKAAIMDAPQEGGVGGTYVGNPVAQAAALAVLDVIEDEGLVERSAAIGETIRARMVALAGALAARSATCAGSARCSRSSCRTRTMAPAPTRLQVVTRLQRGLLLLKAGVTGTASACSFRS